jgi:hypothetical protein
MTPSRITDGETDKISVDVVVNRDTKILKALYDTRRILNLERGVWREVPRGSSCSPSA